MSYVSNSLLPGERVMHQTHLHKIMFFWPVVLALVGLGMGALSPPTSGALLIVSLIYALSTYLRYSSSEFAVTDKRVIIKVGLVQRRTLEMLLAKVEAISVDQGIGGRILGYGSIVVVGTGGTKEAFEKIADPLEFRRAVQAATV